MICYFVVAVVLNFNQLFRNRIVIKRRQLLFTEVENDSLKHVIKKLIMGFIIQPIHIQISFESHFRLQFVNNILLYNEKSLMNVPIYCVMRVHDSYSYSCVPL